jgi:serine/threonine-protein kinase/endoribonuclease IRE1
MLISDFGLCKKLDVDQSSIFPTTYGIIATGTAGWRAPEMIQCLIDGLESLDTLSTNDDTMPLLATTIKGSSSGTSATTCQCLTKSIDIFALGCLFFYILTRGGHPYGNNRFEREANIINGNKDLSLISTNEEAHDLITHLLLQQPLERPAIETCLLHPFFWHSGKRLAFLGEVSDRFEIMSKDPMDMVLVRLERDAKSIIKTDWHQTLDESPGRILIKNLRQSRKYNGNSVRDLLRALRNKVSLSFKYYDYSIKFFSFI